MFGISVLRRKFFAEVVKNLPKFKSRKPDCIAITHALPDKLECLAALSQQVNLLAIVAIPYSARTRVVKDLRKKHCVLRPSARDLRRSQYAVRIVAKFYRRKPLVILDIGGYFSAAAASIHTQLGNHFLGIVEDTEFGHRRYEEVANLVVPVISVARSVLKRSEDALVGPSTYFSFERIVRSQGFVPKSKKVLVLGYGKVGRNLALTARSAGNEVYVYDTDPTARIFALSEGFLCPGRISAIRNADVVFGATGANSISFSDLKYFKLGVCLVSSSSKQIEFPMAEFDSHLQSKQSADSVRKYSVGEFSHFYVVHNGQPANFLDDGVIGPVLALTHGELLAAVSELNLRTFQPGLAELSRDAKDSIARSWLKIFVDGRSGSMIWNEA